MNTLPLVTRWTRPDVSVPLVIAACCLGAFAYRDSLLIPQHTVDALNQRVSLTVPSGWSAEEVDGSLIVAVPSFGIGAEVVVRLLDVPEDDPVAIDLISARVAEERATSGVAYRVLEGEERRLGSLEGTWTHYALVMEPADSSALPIVVRGVDVLAPLDSGELLHVHGFAPEMGGDLDPLVQHVVASVRVLP